MTIGNSFDIGYAWGNTDEFIDHRGNVGQTSITLQKTAVDDPNSGFIPLITLIYLFAILIFIY